MVVSKPISLYHLAELQHSGCRNVSEFLKAKFYTWQVTSPSLPHPWASPSLLLIARSTWGCFQVVNTCPNLICSLPGPCLLFLFSAFVGMADKQELNEGATPTQKVVVDLNVIPLNIEIFQTWQWRPRNL